MKDKSKLYINILCNGTKPVLDPVEEVKTEKKTKTKEVKTKTKKEK